MKVVFVYPSGKEIRFNSVRCAKDFCLEHHLFTPACHLNRISVFRLDSYKRSPYRHGIVTLFDFWVFYRL